MYIASLKVVEGYTMQGIGQTPEIAKDHLRNLLDAHARTTNFPAHYRAGIEVTPVSYKTIGQLRYEQDVRREPVYHDGSPRRTWDELTAAARWSWERE